MTTYSTCFKDIFIWHSRTRFAILSVLKLAIISYPTFSFHTTHIGRGIPTDRLLCYCCIMLRLSLTLIGPWAKILLDPFCPYPPCNFMHCHAEQIGKDVWEKVDPACKVMWSCYVAYDESERVTLCDTRRIASRMIPCLHLLLPQGAASLGPKTMTGPRAIAPFALH